MKIIGFVKNSLIDYPKHISCVVFTPGCNMNCWYCHNKQIINLNEGTINEKEIFDFLGDRKKFIDGVVISGGEPTLQPDLINFIKQIKKLQFKVKLDTNGTNFKTVKTLIDNNLIDYIAIDIKAPLNSYNKITSFSNITDLKKCIEYVKNSNIEYEFRTTYAPNLTFKDIINILSLIKGAKNYSLQAFVKPCHINNTKIMYHSSSEYYDLKKIGEDYVTNFQIKNL